MRLHKGAGEPVCENLFADRVIPLLHNIVYYLKILILGDANKNTHVRFKKNMMKKVQKYLLDCRKKKREAEMKEIRGKIEEITDERHANYTFHRSRAHWKTEAMHWLFDVVLGEDECRILSDNGLKNMNIFKKLSVFFHEHIPLVADGKRTIKSSMFNALLNDDCLLQLLNP